MAEKKFSGAPFGTQTARFDVTGVHPNKKVPGTFTQIPYDKPSTLELNGKCKRMQQERKSVRENSQAFTPNNLKRMSTRMKNIRESLTSANHSLQDIASMQGGRFKHAIGSTPVMPDRSSLSYPSSEKGSRRFSKEVDVPLEKNQLVGNGGNKGCQIKQKTSKVANKDGLSGEEANPLNIEKTDIKSFADANDKVLRVDVSQSNNISNNQPYSQTNFVIEVVDSQAGLESPIDYDRGSEDDDETGSPKGTNKASLLTPAHALQGSLSAASSKGPLNAKSEDLTGRQRSKANISKAVLPYLSVGPAQAASSATSRSKILKIIQWHTGSSSSKGSLKLAEETATSVVSRLKTTPQVTKTETPAIKPVPPKPRISESGSDDKVASSFASSGKTGSFRQKLQGVWAESCDSLLRRKLGPGAYNTSVGGFSTKTVESRASGPGWARQLEVERLASLPHLLYKEQWEENKMLKRKLGPGSYDIKDFIQVAAEKPRSGRGICDKLAPRFEKGQLSTTPGPGTYGIGGVPQRALEDKDGQSTSTKGLLDKGDRKRTLPSVGSHLGPGTYRHKTCTDELLNKVTSLKGPYKLYSGDRNKPISEGYLAAPQLADLGPGQYEIGSFVDELGSKERRTHGKFGKMQQYPEVPTDRLFLFSQAHCNRRDVPGPGAYSAQELSKPTAVNSPGFLSSAKRDDKISQKFFTRNFNPVGAGRYDVQKFDEAQDVNGHSSVFKSKTGKPNLQMAKFLQERIRSKDVSVENRVVLSQPTRMTRSITVM